MNTLTPNRILQEGDEYFEPKGAKGWQPVPEDDYGLQIQFTKYGEVRRPSEKPFPAPNGSSNESQPVPTHAKAQTTEGAKGGDRTHSAAGKPLLMDESGLLPRRPECKPISPNSDLDSRPQGQKSVAAKAEKEKTPAPTPLGAGESLNVKAKLVPMTPEQLAIQAGAAAYNANGHIKITFPKPDPTNLIEMTEQPIWTGRNGTFTGYGLEAMRVNNNVMLSPIGKRGIGNCCIQFPISVIPQVIDFLATQYREKPPK